VNELFALLQQTRPSLTEPPPPEADWAEIGLDSLDLAELAARIEQRFRIEIPDQEWRALANVTQLTAYLETRLAAHE
jgi:acyl carrier protein